MRVALRLLVIDNYRSIEHLDLTMGPLNALIGPNNAGKSNILRALNLVLGETWPTRPFSDRDYHQYDPTRPIEITAFFDQPLRCDPQVHGFRLASFPETGLEYVAVEADGTPCTWPRGGPKRVSNVMRAEVPLLYLDLERQAERTLRTTHWTPYGKLLREVEAGIPAEHKEGFTHAVGTAVEQHLRPFLAAAQEVIDAFVRRQTGLDVTLDFRALDPLEVLKSVRPYVLDGIMTSDPEEVGAGVQSALAIAVAKAYADIVRRPIVVAIEEPELYLHPHGCRHFYTLLRQLSADGLQVIYATHERSFVSLEDFEAVHIVRKPGAATSVRSGGVFAITAGRDRLRLQSRFNDRVNEVFFAAAVVLGEGDPDEIACRCALVREGLDLDQQSLSVLSLGGKDEIPVVAEVLMGFGIPVFGLIDEDPGNAATARTRARLDRVVGPQNVFIQAANLEGLFGLGHKPSRVEAMALFPRWFANTQNPTPQVYRDLAARIRASL
jgi:predicted ATP-dependent endonuclease of OLD family